MSKHIQRIGISIRQDFQFQILLERTPQIDQITAIFNRVAKSGERAIVGISLRGERGNPPAAAKSRALRHTASSLGDILDAAIRKCHVNRFHTLHAHNEKHQAYRRSVTRSRRGEGADN